MTETESLHTASLYINNQLLSRGLLRDGQNIDFAHPGKGSVLIATMGQIMGVVNDLILRRDRDAEHRESLSTTLRTIRADQLRQTNDLHRLRDAHAEAQRKLNLAEAAEAAMRAQLRAAETAVRTLKDEAARQKGLVAQTRASCANEVRKRDRQIESLKKAVSDAGRARGAGRNSAVTSIHVSGEVGGHGRDQGTPRGGTESEAYDLRQETNAFLAELARGLSEENEALLGLVRRTAGQLRQMSGFDKTDEGTAHAVDGNAMALQSGYDELSAEIDAILDHLRTILTNPSFVPIEEVEVREDEINRLRGGWEKMESRWNEAVHLIDGWRRRMAASGRPVNMEELKMGLRLSPVKVRDVEETANGFDMRLEAVEECEEESSVLNTPCRRSSLQGSLHLVPAPVEGEESESESSIFEDDISVGEWDVEEPNIEILQQSTAFGSPPLPVAPQLSPLKDSYTAGNRGSGNGNSKSRHRPGDFTTIIEEDTWDLAADEAPPKPPPHTSKPLSSPEKQPQRQQRSPVRREDPSTRRQDVSTGSQPAPVDLSDSNSSLDSVLLVKPSITPLAPRPSSRHPAPPSSPPNDASTKSARSKGSSAAATNSNNTNTTSSSSRPATCSTSTTSTAATTSHSEGEAARQRNLPSPDQTRAANRSPRRAASRLPLPRSDAVLPLPPPLPLPQQSPLTMATIAAKLAATERDADAARVRAKLKAARLGKRVSLAPPASEGPDEKRARKTSAPEMSGGGGGAAAAAGDPIKQRVELFAAEKAHEARPEQAEVAASASASASAPRLRGWGAEGRRQGGDDVEMQLEPEPEMGIERQELEPELEQAPKPRKRERRVSRVVSRRRSTLSPWELETLISGSANVASPAR